MSTYLSGVTDTGLEPLQYTPNFPYLQQALEKAQAKYDVNFNKIASSYDKISNAVLTNPENITFKDEFVNKADKQLKDVSAMDLSNPDNVNKAQTILAPIWEDKDLLYDHMLTKQIQSQEQEYEKLKTSDKKEQRDMAWDTGLQYVNLSKRDLRFAKRGDGSIQDIKVNEYIPYVNASEIINKELNDRGYKDGIVKTDNNGGYIIEVTNGEGTRKIYESVVDNILSVHPEILKTFKAQGAVKFQDVVDSYRQMGLNETDAVLQAKTSIKNENLKELKPKLSEYDRQLNGDGKEYCGLNDDLQQAKMIYEANVKTSTDEENMKRILEINEMQSKIDDLSTLKENTQRQISSFDEGKDYWTSKGEDYFSDIERNRFVRVFSNTKVNAYLEKLKSDASFVAAQQIDSRIKMNEENNNTKEDIAKMRTLSKTISDKTTKIKEGVSSGEIMFPGEVETHGTDNIFHQFQTGLETNKNAGLTAGVSLLNTSTLSTKIPGLHYFLDYYKDLMNGAPKDSRKYNDDNLKQFFNDLKTNTNIVPSNVTGYNIAPSVLMKSMVDYVKEQSGNNNPQQQEQVLTYERSMNAYAAGNKLYEDFKKKMNPEIKTYFSEGKNKFLENKLKNYYLSPSEIVKYPLLRSDSIVFKPHIPTKDNFLLSENDLNSKYPPVKIGTRAFIQGVLKGDYKLNGDENGIYSATINGKEYKLNDGNTAKLSEVKDFIFSFKELSLNNIKESIDKTNEEFSKTLYGGDKGINMSKTMYINHVKQGDVVDNLIIDSYNTTTPVTKGGDFKPLNYKDYEDVDEKKMNPLLSFLHEPGNATKYVTKVQLSGIGDDGEPKIKLYINTDGLSKEGNYNSTEYRNELRALQQNGIELSISQPAYEQVTNNHYMSSGVSDYMVKNGMMKSNSYEENKLGYKYRVTQGANNTYNLVVARQLLKNGKLEWEDIDNIPPQQIPQEFGIDGIYSIINEYTSGNSAQINSYRALLSQKSSIFVPPNGQFTTDYYTEMFKKINYANTSTNR